MKERPILFSAPMVRAILAGKKTQTRRVVKPQPAALGENGGPLLRVVGTTLPSGNGFDAQYAQDNPRYIGCCPYGQPGDRLWVREAHAPQSDCWGAWQRLLKGEHVRDDELTVYYASDYSHDERPFIDRWRPPIHMPRAASRILLEVVAVRVERLQDITEDDARAEGITDGGCLNCGNPEPCGCEDPQPDARDAFIHLWQSINGAESWAANPWVWIVEFRMLRHG